MLVTVVVINVLLALFGFYIAWHVWKLRLALSRAANTLLAAERTTYNVLHGAPEAILRGQIGTRQLRKSYQQLEPKFQQVKQALTLLSLGNTVLRRRSSLSLPKLNKKPTSKRR